MYMYIQHKQNYVYMCIVYTYTSHYACIQNYTHEGIHNAGSLESLLEPLGPAGMAGGRGRAEEGEVETLGPREPGGKTSMSASLESSDRSSSLAWRLWGLCGPGEGAGGWGWGPGPLASLGRVAGTPLWGRHRPIREGR